MHSRLEQREVHVNEESSSKQADERSGDLLLIR